MVQDVLDLIVKGKLRKARTRRFGDFKVFIVTKTSRNKDLIDWGKTSKFKASIYYVNPKAVSNKSSEHIVSCTAATSKAVLSQLFSKFWAKLYGYAVIMGNTEYQKVYLNHRIKKHGWWHDYHTDMSFDTDTNVSFKHASYADFNANKIVQLTETLNSITQEDVWQK